MSTNSLQKLPPSSKWKPHIFLIFFEWTDAAHGRLLDLWLILRNMNFDKFLVPVTGMRFNFKLVSSLFHTVEEVVIAELPEVVSYHTIAYNILHLVDYVFVAADVVLEAHRRFPGVILSVQTAAGAFAVSVTSHSQRVSADRHTHLM